MLIKLGSIVATWIAFLKANYCVPKEGNLRSQRLFTHLKAQWMILAEILNVFRTAFIKSPFCIKKKWTRALSAICLVMGLLNTSSSRACSLDLDPSLGGICDALNNALYQKKLGLTAGVQSEPASIDIDAAGRAELSSAMLIVNEAVGKAIAPPVTYSFRIQDLDLDDEAIAKTTFKCKTEKCIKVRGGGVQNSFVSNVGLTAYSYEVADMVVESFKRLRLMFGVPTKGGEPIRLTCGRFDSNLPSARIVGWKGDLFEIHHRGRIIYANFGESRELMGGAQDQLRCEDIGLSKHTVSVRMGWKNDLLMVFALEYDLSDNLIGIWQHTWLIRDGSDIDISITNPNSGGGDVLVRYGQAHDLKARLCFSQNDKLWRQSKVSSGAVAPSGCDTIVSTTKVLP